MRIIRTLLAMTVFCLFMLCSSAAAEGQTHALLIACSDFISQPDLGTTISGNLHMVGSAFISSDIPLGSLSIEDGTIGTTEAFESAVSDAFSASTEEDLSILYLCTHGVLSSADDNQVYLLLGDGENESALSAQQLYACIAPIQGEKLLILDACFSGALIGRGQPGHDDSSGSHEQDFLSPFLMDSSVHVLTSANGYESSWYYDSEKLASGAVSYFASALSSGLGLYGAAEADLNGDSIVTLTELHRYLSVSVPSSSSQLLSSHADRLMLPTASSAMLSRPLMGFSYGSSLLYASDPTLDFSFTVTSENTAVQYRLIDFTDGSWDWQNARTFLDAGDLDDGTLTPGRKNRALSLDALSPDEGGYMMLQIFSVTDGALLLCSERLIAVQSAQNDAQLSISLPSHFDHPGLHEMHLDIHLSVPAEITVAVHDESGMLVRRLASSQLTRPSSGSITHLYWDGRDEDGSPVSDGQYTISAETLIGGDRQRTSSSITISSP